MRTVILYIGLINLFFSHYVLSLTTTQVPSDNERATKCITSSTGHPTNLQHPAQHPSLTKLPVTLSKRNATHDYIPGLVTKLCDGNGGQGQQIGLPPCTAYCHKTDANCLRAASSIMNTCLPSWKSYWAVQDLWSSMPSSEGWSQTLVIEGTPTILVTTTTIYTSFSKATEYYINGFESTVYPVYALGTPIITRTTTTWGVWTSTVRTAPTPQCSYYDVAEWERGDFSSMKWNTTDPASYTPWAGATRIDCGQCAISGGNVQLYFWPSPTASAHVNSSASITTDLPVRTTVLHGTTLTSPTVYIALHNLSALNSCSAIGRTIASTFIGMNPEDVSTLVHIGGKVAQSGANQYGTLNYNFLTGLPPVSVYEAQPSCGYAGCPTIYPTPWSPTLVLPSQVRSMDPAWASCEAALNGLYDPPIPLTAQSYMAPYSAQATARPSVSTDGPSSTWNPVATASKSHIATHPDMSGLLKSAAIIHSKSPPNPSLASTNDLSSPVLDTNSPQGTSRTTLLGSDYDPAKTGDPTHIRSNGESPSQSRAPVYSAISGSESSTPHRESATPGKPEQLPSITYAAPSSSTSKAAIRTNADGQYIVNGHTFAPGTPITLPGHKGPVTFRMITSSSHTFVAIDSLTTIELGDGHPNSINNSALAFTRASNGDFVLHGTTLSAGSPVTIGSGSSVTTLEITSVHSTPALIIDGSISEILSAASSPRNTFSPTITESFTGIATAGVKPTQTSRLSTTATTTTRSGGARRSPAKSMIAASICLWSLFRNLR